MIPATLEPFAERFACPACRQRLDMRAVPLRCTSCGLSFPQPDPGRWLDLLPGDLPELHRNRWAERQQLNEESYRELVADPDHATLAYGFDYGALADVFAELAGEVLDVGGGAGIVRDYLSEPLPYLVVDPSLDWLGPDWLAVADRIPCLGRPLPFVRGIAERLPLADRSFDSVLSVFSLNHVASVDESLSEMRRVVRPGGTILLVLEDMPPTWGELRRGDGAITRPAARLAAAFRKLAGPLAPHPVQPDHLPLTERRISAGLRPASLDLRRLLAGPNYLVLRYRIPG